jgi:ABC-2 type transport system permease protein
MTAAIVIVVGAVVLALRIWMRGRRRRGQVPSPEGARPPRRGSFGDSFGDVGLVALREIRERVRGRIFRVGTVIILLVVAGAIVIPVIHGGKAGPQEVGVVGPADPALQPLIQQAGARAGTSVRLVPEPSVRAAADALRSGAIDLAVVDGDRVVVNAPVTADSTTTVATVAQEVAVELGIEHAYREAGLSGSQVAQLANARPVPVQSLQPSTKGTARTTSVIGLILVFLMLTQYNTWILMGVMQEKASRVVEVLLATVRPIQLLGGKVLGIGLVAMGQAAVIVVFALVLAEAVGSDLLHGTAPLVLASELVWLFLGYAFYCWVYAAAGSMAERQDQVQTLALPLSLPIIVGYVLALTTAATGNPSVLFEVLAYLPPTAPFAMPVLVGLGDVAWWQFLASVLISIAGTVAMALVAAGVYRRAVLRSGQQVRVRELFSRPAGKRRGTAGVPG